MSDKNYYHVLHNDDVKVLDTILASNLDEAIKIAKGNTYEIDDYKIKRVWFGGEKGSCGMNWG